MKSSSALSVMDASVTTTREPPVLNFTTANTKKTTGERDLLTKSSFGVSKLTLWKNNRKLSKYTEFGICPNGCQYCYYTRGKVLETEDFNYRWAFLWIWPPMILNSDTVKFMFKENGDIFRDIRHFKYFKLKKKEKLFKEMFTINHVFLFYKYLNKARKSWNKLLIRYI